MNDKERKAMIQEGRNQVLYLLLAIGDEHVAHDHWHPDVAETLLKARRTIVRRLAIKDEHPDGYPAWPKEWPDFQEYTYTSG